MLTSAQHKRQSNKASPPKIKQPYNEAAMAGKWNPEIDGPLSTEADLRGCRHLQFLELLIQQGGLQGSNPLHVLAHVPLPPQGAGRTEGESLHMP